MAILTSLACVWLGLTLVAVVSGNCPPVEELQCGTPDVCPKNRPFKVFSYIPPGPSTGGYQCTGCGYCVASDEVCPELPCPMFHPGPGCNVRLYPVMLNVAGNQCMWQCDVLRC
ncbi:uncharacterized protein LOC132758657 [Ruditapes philippinarum]|uniref:uncharacterized protein LOC132758657 n=1 Tax=Ruditapes philippinarum TaxID=129788 RepID=UPI00295AEB3B|nr:uncharacterized protein LOC132758657 [Ruditapes philippinarum]